MRALFYGLGSDGTVGANKNSIKIIGEDTDNYAQGYFVYDSKKSGAVTVSHLRFGPKPIRSTYLISQANFVACHQFSLPGAATTCCKAPSPGATFLLNSPYGPDEVWDQLPARRCSEQIIDKKLKFYVIDAYKVAKRDRHGRRASTPSCRPASSPSPACCRATRPSPRSRTPSRRPTASAARPWCKKNFAAVDAALAHLHEVKVPGRGHQHVRPAARRCPPRRPSSCRRSLAAIIAGDGDEPARQRLPGRRHLPHRHHAVGEAQHRPGDPGLGSETLCIQCGKCVLVCPHAAIRAKVYDADAAEGRARRPSSRPPARWQEFKDQKYTLQVAPEDCTGCALCVEVCPAKNKQETQAQGHQHGAAAAAPRDRSAANWDFFLTLPEIDRGMLNLTQVKDVAAPAAAVRVLRRLRRLRRDALRQAADASSSATAPSSPTPPAAPRSTAATCPPRPTPSTATAAARPGPTRCSRTTPSSASACA